MNNENAENKREEKHQKNKPSKAEQRSPYSKQVNRQSSYQHHYQPGIIIPVPDLLPVEIPEGEHIEQPQPHIDLKADRKELAGRGKDKHQPEKSCT